MSAPFDRTSSLARRLRVGGSVALLSVFAVGATLLVQSVAERPTFRWRVDLSEVRRNSLDPETERVLRELPEEVVAEVFFRPERSRRGPAQAAAIERVRDLLDIARGLAPDRFSAVVHDTSDLAVTRARMEELGLREENAIVLVSGDRRALLRLEPDLCELGPDPMDPQRVAVADFHGETALVEGLLKVAAAERPLVVFTQGHGEADLGLDGPCAGAEQPDSLCLLVGELVGDGFGVEVWNGKTALDLPSGTDVVAIVAPSDPFEAGEVERLRAFVEDGGRLLVVAGPRPVDGLGGLADLLAPYGMLLRKGVVSLPYYSLEFNRMMTESVRCADFSVAEAGLNSSHPITRPTWEAARGVRVILSRWFERGVLDGDGVLLDLLTSPREGWVDLPDARGRHDWHPGDPREVFGARSLAMAAELPVAAPEGEAQDGAAAAAAAPRRGRVVAFGSPVIASNGPFATNRDLLMNAFNWLAERDLHVRVRPRERASARIDVVRGDELASLRALAWSLPGLAALLGLFLAWRRRG